MIERFCLLSISAMLLLLAGCASVSTTPQAGGNLPGGAAADATQQTPLPGQAADAIIVEPVPKPIESTNKAVIALLDRSKIDFDAGQREAAGSSLERALRIEPRNPWLWYELAQLRLAQGQYAQAISLSHKSIAFAGHERPLQALNWRLIGNARVAQGDPTGAEQAFKRAAALEIQL